MYVLHIYYTHTHIYIYIYIYIILFFSLDNYPIVSASAYLLFLTSVSCILKYVYHVKYINLLFA